MQEKPVPGLECRERDQWVLVVDKADIGGVAEQLGTVEGHGLVQLQRVARAPEIAVGKKQLVERCVDFNGGFEVQKVQAAGGQTGFINLEWSIGDAGEVGMLLAAQLDALGFHLAIETDEEVIDVEVVLEKNVVAQFVEIARAQRIQRNCNAGNIGCDELKNFGSDMKVTQDQKIRVGTNEGFQSPIDGPVQNLRRGKPIGNRNLENLEDDQRQLCEWPYQREHKLTGFGAGVGQQGSLDFVAERQTGIEVERQP